MTSNQKYLIVDAVNARIEELEGRLERLTRHYDNDLRDLWTVELIDTREALAHFIALVGEWA